MNLTEYAQKIDDLITEVGWEHNTPGGRGPNGELCLMNATAYVICNHNTHVSACDTCNAESLHVSMVRRLDKLAQGLGHRWAAIYNDDPSTTREDISLLLKKAGSE